MSPADLRAVVLRVLGEIAPEADLASLRGDADLREALDIDSYDFLRFATRLHDELGIAVPEDRMSGLATLEGSVALLGELQ